MIKNQDKKYLDDVKRAFYPVKDKIIPHSYIKEFTLRAAAHLIMDDGCEKKGRYCQICTQGFDLKSVQILKLAFANIGIQV